MQDIRHHVRPATISYIIAPDVELSDRDINSLTLPVASNPSPCADTTREPAAPDENSK